MKAAYKQTGYEWLLCADISAFFPSIKVQEALDILHGQTHYRNNQELKRISETVVYGGKDGSEGLLQGNPMSPLLANLVCDRTIDKTARNLGGPYLRYVDDILLMQKSLDDCRIAFGELQKAATAHNLALHEGKSYIVHVPTGRIHPVVNTGERLTGPPTYLKVEIRDKEGDMEFHLVDGSVARLMCHLRKAVKDSPVQLSGYLSQEEEDAAKEKIEDNKAIIQNIWAGWLMMYGGLNWSPNQEQCIRLLAELSGLDPAEFQSMKAEAMRRWTTAMAHPAGLSWYRKHKKCELSRAVQAEEEELG